MCGVIPLTNCKLLSNIMLMETTTATYNIRVETCDFKVIEFQRTLPTKPTTQKGIKAQNNKLEQWVMKELPFWSKIDITSIN